MGVKGQGLQLNKRNSNFSFDLILKIYFDGFPKKKWPLNEELILFMMHFQQVKLQTLFSIIHISLIHISLVLCLTVFSVYILSCNVRITRLD